MRRIICLPLLTFAIAYGQSNKEVRDAKKDSILFAYHAFQTQFDSGARDYAKMPQMAMMADKFKDHGKAIKIANEYIRGYLLRLSDDDLFTEKNLEFMASFTGNSDDPGFTLFRRKARQVDRVMKMPFSRYVIDHVVTKEEINPELYGIQPPAAGNPEWHKLTSGLKKKYGRVIARRVILYAKISWYDQKKDTPQLLRCFVAKADKYGLDTFGLAKFNENNRIYSLIFWHSTDPRIIRKGVKWMGQLVKANPKVAGFLDTYANLLYKAGEVEDAVKAQGNAVALAPKNEEYLSNLHKMQKHIPTWPG